jgi:hypothetical protein
MAYYTDSGPRSRPLRYPDAPAAIGVLESRTDRFPVGIARVAGWDEDGVALWKLTVLEAELPGRWIVVDREFVPANQSGRWSSR